MDDEILNGGGEPTPQTGGGEPASSDAANEWAQLANEFTFDDTAPEPTEPAPAAPSEGAQPPAEPAPPATPPVAEPQQPPAQDPGTQQATPPAPPQPEPPQQQQPEPPVQPQQPPQQQMTDEQRGQLRARFEAELAKGYGLSEEDAAAVNADPAAALPQLAARMHVRVLEDATNSIMQSVMGLLPQLIPQMIQQQSQRAETENAFYTQWPELKEHSADVMRAAQAYRQNNPQASVEQTIKEVGAVVWMAKGLPVATLATRMAGKPQQQPPAQQPPAQPIVGLNPAPAPGAAGTTQEVLGDDNFWAGFVKEFEY